MEADFLLAYHAHHSHVSHSKHPSLPSSRSTDSYMNANNAIMMMNARSRTHTSTTVPVSYNTPDRGKPSNEHKYLGIALCVLLVVMVAAFLYSIFFGEDK